MATTINHTGRVGLERKHYRIDLSPANGGAGTFDLALHMDDLSIDGNARVFVEAYIKNIRRRFDFGRVSLLQRPSDTSLAFLPKTGVPQFRVLLVEDADERGKIVAHAKGNLGNAGDGSGSLLVVESTDLGEIAWTVEIEGDEKPRLCINNRFGNGVDLISNRADFQAFILPAALRIILTSYFEDDQTEDPDTIQGMWWALAEDLGGEFDGQSDTDDFDGWMNSVVSEFSSRHNLASAMQAMLEGE